MLDKRVCFTQLTIPFDGNADYTASTVVCHDDMLSSSIYGEMTGMRSLSGLRIEVLQIAIVLDLECTDRT